MVIEINNRQKQILKLLGEQSPLSNTVLANRLGVTTATIRKDLLILEQASLVIRLRGKAALSEVTKSHSDSQLLSLFSKGQLAIAKAALKYFDKVDSAIIDGGSTMLALVHLLNLDHRVAIATPSIEIAQQLAGKQNASTNVSGGELLSRTLYLVGENAYNFFDSVSADILFLGTTGIRQGKYLTTNDSSIGTVKHNMIRAAKKVILLAEDTKFSGSGMFMFADFHDIDVFITTDSLDPKMKDQIQSFGVELICVQPF